MSVTLKLTCLEHPKYRGMKDRFKKKHCYACAFIHASVDPYAMNDYFFDGKNGDESRLDVQIIRENP